MLIGQVEGDLNLGQWYICEGNGAVFVFIFTIMKPQCG